MKLVLDLVANSEHSFRCLLDSIQAVLRNVHLVQGVDGIIKLWRSDVCINKIWEALYSVPR